MFFLKWIRTNDVYVCKAWTEFQAEMHLYTFVGTRSHSHCLVNVSSIVHWRTPRNQPQLSTFNFFRFLNPISLDLPMSLTIYHWLFWTYLVESSWDLLVSPVESCRTACWLLTGPSISRTLGKCCAQRKGHWFWRASWIQTFVISFCIDQFAFLQWLSIGRKNRPPDQQN